MNEMRKHNIICLSICLVGLLAALAIAYTRYTVPYWQCSEVYKRYHKADGVRATFVKNYALNDSVKIDVVLLEATSDDGWAIMQDDLGIVPRPPEVEALCDTNTIDIWLASKDDYRKGMDSVLLNNDAIAVSYYRHIVSIFIIETEKQIDGVINYQLLSTK